MSMTYQTLREALREANNKNTGLSKAKLSRALEVYWNLYLGYWSSDLSNLIRAVKERFPMMKIIISEIDDDQWQAELCFPIPVRDSLGQHYTRASDIYRRPEFALIDVAVDLWEDIQNVNNGTNSQDAG